MEDPYLLSPRMQGRKLQSFDCRLSLTKHDRRPNRANGMLFVGVPAVSSATVDLDS